MAKINVRDRNKDTGRKPNWEYRFELPTENGKRKQYSKAGFKTKKMALEAGAAAMIEFSTTGTVFTPSTMSVAEFYDLWYNQYCKPRLKYSTLSTYSYMIREQILPRLGKYEMGQLTPAVLQSFYDSLFDSYRSNTISGVMGMVNNSLNYAVHPLGILKENPVNYIIRKKKGTKIKPTVVNQKVVLNDDDIANLFTIRPFGDPYYIPYLLGLYCGLRIGEASAVTWDDVDFENETLFVKFQMRYKDNGSRAFTDSYSEVAEIDSDNTKIEHYLTPPKYESARIIALGHTLTEILKKEKRRQEMMLKGHEGIHIYYYAQQFIDKNNEQYTKLIKVKGMFKPPGAIKVNFVCVRLNGEVVTPWAIAYDIRNHLRKMMEKDFTFHSLRHTHATKLIEMGAPPHAVQERLGHKNVAVTMETYTHNSVAMSNELTEKVIELTEKIPTIRGQTVDKK